MSALVRSPIILAKELDNAYRKIEQAKPLPRYLLGGFQILRDYLLQHHLNDTEVDYSLATQNILIAYAEDELTHLRYQHNLPPFKEDSTIEDIKSALQKDGASENEILIGASYIYHRHIRYELALSVPEFAKAYAQSNRQLQRLANRYLEHLAQRIINDELTAKAQRQQFQIHLSIPQFTGIALESQRIPLNKHINAMSRQDYRTILLTGEAGVGKSTAGLILTHHLIDQIQINRAAYIDLKHYQQVHSQPTERMLRQIIKEKLEIPLHMTLEEAFIVLRNVDDNHLLFLDHIDTWQPVINRMWSILSHFYMVTTAQTNLPMWPSAIQHIQPLTNEDALRLLQFKHTGQNDRALYERIIDNVGTNPRHLIYALAHSNLAPLNNRFIENLREERVLSAWDKLPSASKILLVWMAIIYESDIDITYDDIHQHIASHLVEAEADIYQYLESLVNHNFITYDSASETYAIYDIDIDILTNTIDFQNILGYLDPEQFPEAWIIGYFELASLTEDIHYWREWLSVGRNYFKQIGEYQRWLTFLKRMRHHWNQIEKRQYIDLEIAIIHRRCGYMDDATKILDSLIESIDENRSIPLLIEVNIEQSWINYLSGKYEIAEVHANEAAILADTIHNIPLTDRSLHAWAQAVSQHDPEYAHDLLKNIDVPDIQTWDLLARLEMNVGDLESAAYYAHKTVEETKRLRTSTNYAKAIALVGRVLQGDGDNESAINHYGHAINLLLDKQDWLSLAPLCFNYSSACINHLLLILESKDEQDNDFRELLRLAENICQRGLRLTKNLQNAYLHEELQNQLRIIQKLSLY